MKIKITLLFTVLIFVGTIYRVNGQVDNTFTGENSGLVNTGNYNTGYGVNALRNNTSNSNSAFGVGTLSNTTGGFNCAFGNQALALNGNGRLNCAFGTSSLSNNKSGSSNIAIGHRSQEANISGNNNTAIGYATLLTNLGSSNTVLGSYSPRNLLTGDSNIFIGAETAINLLNGSNNVFLGNRITVPKSPSTPILAGNDTSNSIIFADGLGNQKIFIQKNGNTGIGLGNNVIPVNRLDIKGGVAIGNNFTPNGVTPGIVAPTSGLIVEGKVGIGTSSPNNKVEITSGINGNSGLRFTDLTSNFTPATSIASNRFLTVNQNGDVVLNKIANPIETNVLTSNANLMTSNVNSISSSSTIINSISNSVNSNNQLITTVNGVASAPVNLPETDEQSLSLTGSTLSISNGNSVTLPTYNYTPQILTQSENTITLSNGGGSFTLPTFNDTDAQSLALNGNTLSISNGNSVTLPTYVDTPQTLSQTGNTVTLSNGGGSFNIPNTSVTAGTNVTVSGSGTSASPYVISAGDASLYANNGTINSATTTNGNRVVTMNNSNIWFQSAASDTNSKIYIGTSATYPTTSGNYKLFVEGGILTEKVKVALRSTANWADYVFEKNYDLMPLKNVEEYIAIHKHLPGIDSASELAKNGLDLAEMQAKHMAKIEEMMLYIIDQNKTIEKNIKDIEELKKQVKVLTANED
ncbi:MAG: beta strand repeat-containing protein [Flavobacterium sp.]|uniref:beta strand repeat-containing protein n=1 Tax=Flavobacterium sp. TaxID=239 RepID=UPI003BD0FF18